MDFLQKLDFLMEKYSLNKLTLSQNSGIPYSTIVGWYKKGYEGLKLTTLRKLSDYFNTALDYWVNEDELDPNYWKADGFIVNGAEMGHIQKYRLLDPYGKEAVDGVLDVESRRCEAARAAIIQEQRRQMEAAEDKIIYIFPGYSTPMSAGTGQPAGEEYPENYRLVKEPPRGASYIAPVSGDSMEPTYQDGDLLFIRAQEQIGPGQIGVFFMDGQQWVKELGDGVLLSHNPEYEPRLMTDDIRCQGLVLGVCDESYFE
ncbi:MAG: LexA family transcriptional regulator [Oscillospiraceae bacterium]|nr:LexA family transcriptional regulator [Oscillospiraceae bacterium]